MANSLKLSSLSGHRRQEQVAGRDGPDNQQSGEPVAGLVVQRARTSPCTGRVTGRGPLAVREVRTPRPVTLIVLPALRLLLTGADPAARRRRRTRRGMDIPPARQEVTDFRVFPAD